MTDPQTDKQTCGDCEREFNLDTDYTEYDYELQMYICLTCQCVRSQVDRIDVLEKKIEQLEHSIEQNQIHEMEMREVD